MDYMCDDNNCCSEKCGCEHAHSWVKRLGKADDDGETLEATLKLTKFTLKWKLMTS